MKNKLICLLCAFMMVLLSPVYASDTKTTDLSLTVDQSYEWSAPAAITFTTNASTETKSGTVSVTQNIIAGGKKLVIKISSSEDFKINAASGGAYRTYQVKKGSSAVAAGGTVLEVAAGTNTGSQSLDFILQSVATPVAGTFTGTCDFEASIVNAS